MAWTSPRTWVDGEQPPAATFNQHIRDQFLSLGGTTEGWTSFTPTIVQGFTPTSSSGRMKQHQKTTLVSMFFTLNSASADIVIAYPAAPQTPYSSLPTPCGFAVAGVNGVAYYAGTVFNYPGGTGSFAILNGGGSSLWGTGLGWTAGSSLAISLTYEAA